MTGETPGKDSEMLTDEELAKLNAVVAAIGMNATLQGPEDVQDRDGNVIAADVHTIRVTYGSLVIMDGETLEGRDVDEIASEVRGYLFNGLCDVLYSEQEVGVHGDGYGMRLCHPARVKLHYLQGDTVCGDLCPLAEQSFFTARAFNAEIDPM